VLANEFILNPLTTICCGIVADILNDIVVLKAGEIWMKKTMVKVRSMRYFSISPPLGKRPNTLKKEDESVCTKPASRPVYGNQTALLNNR